MNWKAMRPSRPIAVAALLVALATDAYSASAQTLEEIRAAHELGDYKTAHRGFRALAERGNVDAQFRLGLMYGSGEGGPENDAEAVKWLHRAAGRGHPRAQLALGMRHWKGDGVRQDYIQAKALLGRAAAQGDGDAEKFLGYMYFHGKGVPRDYARAVNWFGRAAARGDANAQFEIGIMYYNGEGLPRNFRRAAKWLGLSARRGHAPAQGLFGFMYEYGQGIARNPVKAHKWYNLASSRLSPSRGKLRELAKRDRDRVASRLSPAQLDEAQRLAREWRPLFYIGMSVLTAPLANGGDVQLAELQWALLKLGYDIGTPDGIFGPRTRNAIRSFQISAGMIVNGRLSEQLENSVISAYLAAD
ncbi:MAG: SEL1-like repeat protein [Rhodospirillales bacterium]|nr:SEL1-like repeat protein [Rhodospirillales bacterium]